MQPPPPYGLPGQSNGASSGSRLLDPAHVLAAANADRATFDADRGGAKLEQVSGIAVAVVDIVEPSGPSARSLLHQAIEDRDTDQRPPALAGSGLCLSVQGLPVSGS